MVTKHVLFKGYNDNYHKIGKGAQEKKHHNYICICPFSFKLMTRFHFVECMGVLEWI